MHYNDGNKKRKGLETASLSTDTKFAGWHTPELQIIPFCFLLRVSSWALLIEFLTIKLYRNEKENF